MRLGSKSVVLELSVSRGTEGWIARSQRTATDQVSRPAFVGVERNTAPEQAEYAEVAMIAMHARTAEFDEFATHAFVGCEAELLLAVVPEMRGGELPRLETISADDFAGLIVLDEQMIAIRIVSIFVATEGVRRGETLAEFEIEDLKAEALRRFQILRRCGQVETIAGTAASAGRQRRLYGRERVHAALGAAAPVSDVSSRKLISSTERKRGSWRAARSKARRVSSTASSGERENLTASRKTAG